VSSAAGLSCDDGVLGEALPGRACRLLDHDVDRARSGTGRRRRDPMIDAPVSAGCRGAAATPDLHGLDDDAWERSVIASMGKTIVHAGGVGNMARARASQPSILGQDDQSFFGERSSTRRSSFRLGIPTPPCRHDGLALTRARRARAKRRRPTTMKVRSRLRPGSRRRRRVDIASPFARRGLCTCGGASHGRAVDKQRPGRSRRQHAVVAR